ncbi:MAG: Tn3 family transposase [Aestuariibacter sp.]|nr:Tn3 family transposase [Aestuariibacter sp.]MCP5017459.1 Tn3 family transposase [Ketobacter sp.]
MVKNNSDDGKLILLNDAEYAALYGLPPFDDDDRDRYLSLSDDELKLFGKRSTDQLKIYFVLILGYTKHSSVIRDIDWSESKEDIAYIRKRYLGNRKVTKAPITRNQKKRLYDLVQDHLNIKKLTESDESKLVQQAKKLAANCADKVDILDELISHISNQSYMIPPLSVFQSIISEALNSETNRLKSITASYMSKALETAIENLLETHSDITLSSLKRGPREFKASEMDAEVKVYDFLVGLIPDIETVIQKLKVSPFNIRYYAKQVDHYTITQLRTLDSDRSHLYMVCFLYFRWRQVGDNLANAFIYHVRKLETDAKIFGKEQIVKELNKVEENIKKAASILGMFVDDSVKDELSFKRVRQLAFKQLNAADIEKVKNHLLNLTADKAQYEWIFIDQQRRRIQKFLRQLFQRFDLGFDMENPLLFDQVIQTQEAFRHENELTHFDRRLAPKKQRQYLYLDEDCQQVNPLRVEFFLYKRVKELLEKRKLFLLNSQSYEPIDADLVEDKDLDRLLKESLLPSMKQPGKKIVADKMNRLTDLLVTVGDRLRLGENTSVVLKTQGGKTHWVVKYTKKTEEVNNPFFRAMPQTHIADLLAFVNQETKFFNAFKHAKNRGKLASSDFDPLVACIIANATRYGIFKMADICNFNHDKLRIVQANLLRMETLRAANDRVSDAVAGLPIFKYYYIQAGKIHASSDGQKLKTKRKTIRTRFSTKYIKTGPGVSGLTLTAHFVPLYGKIIGLNEHESHFVFDLLYNNTSEIQPDIISTDSHGSNRFNFALLDLAGWTFAPRYANVNKEMNQLFRVEEIDGTHEISLLKPIDVDLICENWSFIQKVMVSLTSRSTSQASIVRKLSGTAGANQQFKALAEYNRLIKCIYLLEYVDDDKLRQYVQKSLNRGEAYHQLQRHIEEINGARFKGDDKEIDEAYECARLLANCMIFFNALILSHLLMRFEKHKRPDLVDITKKVSPVAWAHININGSYIIDFMNGVQLDIEALMKPVFDRNGVMT